jgi:glycosyltransferase involved in cell wall biosynthesis
VENANFDVTIVIPAYQEEVAVGYVVTSLLRALEGSAYSYEVIVVNDGSSDATAKKASDAGATVVSHPYNMGYGAALKTGVRRSKGRTVIFMDADGQHDPVHVVRLLDERERYDMVVGARRGTAGSPLWRKPGKKLLGWIANHLTGREIPDLNSGLRALDRKMALRFLPIMPNGFSFSTTSTIAAFRGGYTVQYIPIEVAQRVGKSTITAADGMRTLLLIIRIVTLFAPLRVFLPISLLTFMIGAGFIGYGYATLGQASLKGIVVVLASLLFFLFGILVDQVAAIRRGENISS